MENNQLLKLMELLEIQKNLIGKQSVIIKNLAERVLRLETQLEEIKEVYKLN